MKDKFINLYHVNQSEILEKKNLFKTELKLVFCFH